MATLRDNIADTAWVALTSSGDFMQGGAAGAMSRGRYCVDIMSAMRYDAVALGNHEFDFGVPRMLTLVSSAGLPVTCANLKETETDQMIFTPYIIRRYGDRRIAFVGVVTPATMQSEAYAFYDEDGRQRYDLCAATMHQEVQKAVDAARAEGADYVILLAHLGEAVDGVNPDSHSIVAATRGIDAVFDGHTHSVVECCMVGNVDGRMVPVTQTGTQFAYIGKLYLSPEGHVSPRLIETDTLPVAASRTKAVTDSIRALMAATTSEVVCHSAFPLVVTDSRGDYLVRYAESNAGDVVTDAFRAHTGADIALMNGGGIRADIAAGNVTMGDIIDLIPYENALVVAEATGAMIVETLEACCKRLPALDGSFPQVAGMRFTVDTCATPRVSEVMVIDRETNAWRPIDPSTTYTVATIDYALKEGGMEGKLREAKVVRTYSDNYQQVVADYLRVTHRGVMPDCYAKPRGRIVVK